MADIYCEFDRTSLNEAKKKLSQLTEFEKSAVVAKGLSEGSRIIANETRKNIDQRLKQKTGNLRGSVSTVTKKKDKKAWIGFKRPKGAHAHILEYGTAPRYTKSGAYRGSGGAYKFQEDAVDRKGQEALETMAESIIKSIEKIMNA